MEKVFLADGLRTPIALRRGGLGKIRPEAFGAAVIRALLSRTRCPEGSLSGVIAGNAVGTGGNIARLMALMAGLPVEVPAFTIDMQCASAAAAISMAYAKIRSGEGSCYIAGGMESASLQPLRVYARLDDRSAETAAAGVSGGYYTAQFAPGDLRSQTMLYGAESVIEAEQVTKDEMDAWVLRSHQRAARAAERGIFSDVILPIGPCAEDEGVATRISQRLLDRLPPVLGKGTLLNAANACRINDGAAFVLLASGSFAEKYGLPVQAELIGTAALGCNPSESPRGAQRTAEALLHRQGLSFGNLSAIEFNEAFAVIDVLFARRYPELVERYNRFGGALAYGHPYGASGAILMLQLLKSLEAAGGGLGLLSIAGAGGLGEAILMKKA